MIVVFGKDNGGYAKGVGSGVTYKRYFDLTRTLKVDEILLLVENKIEKERYERQEQQKQKNNLIAQLQQT